MAQQQIVGVVLVRNEDLRVGQAVKNVAAFCDRIILADHGSSDGTPAIRYRKEGDQIVVKGMDGRTLKVVPLPPEMARAAALPSVY